MKSNLEPVGQGSKKTFLDLIEKKLAGGNLNVSDPRVYRDRAGAIAAGTLTDPVALQADIGNGLSITDYERLSGYMEKARTAKGKARLALKNKTVKKMASPQISTTSFFGGEDKVGEANLHVLNLDLDDALDKGLGDGKNFEDMLDPRHPDYVLGRIIDRYRRTMPEIMRDQARAIREGSAASANGAADIEKRKPGESIADYFKRTR